LLKILIIDDHPIFRQGLKLILDELAPLHIYEASNSEESINILKNNLIDLVTLDINLPGQDGVQLFNILKKEFPKIKVIVVSMYNSEIIKNEFFKNGAAGFISKDEVSDILLSSVKAILNGKSLFTFDETLPYEQDVDDKLQNYFLLSESEKAVFKLLAEGNNTKQIAIILNKSYKTIHNQKISIFRKMNIVNSIDLLKIAVKLNLLDL